jgi:hypothetical protein
VRTQRLRAEFESIRFKEGESIVDFTMRLSSLVAALGTLGEEIKEQQVVQKLLRVVPKHLSQVAIAIEVTQDLSKLTLEDVGGRLHAAEDRAEEDALPPPRVDGKLLLTVEQWKEKCVEEDDALPPPHVDGKVLLTEEHWKGSSGGSERRRPHKRGNGGKKGAQCDDKCHNCGRTNHWARDCHQLKERANLTQAEEDEELALLMAMAEEIEDAPAPSRTVK